MNNGELFGLDRRSQKNTLCLGCVLLGLLMRLLVIPFSLHVDPRFTGDIATFPQTVQIWNSSERQSTTFIYPPLAYVTMSIYLLNLPKTFTQDLWDKPIAGLAARFKWIASPFVFRDLFVLKAWYLLPDLAIGFLLWRMLRSDPTKAKIGLLAWIFNPLVLYTAYFHGQFDLIPVFFVVLSLFLIQKEKPVWAAFWIGIGACYKNFPFVFLLPLALIMDRTWFGRFKLLLIGAIPYIILFIPNLKSYAGQGSHLAGNFFPAGYDLGFGNQVFFFLIFYAILLWTLYLHRASIFEDFWRACFAILLVYYQFSYFDLHYWVWIVPFAILYLVEQPKKAIPFYATIGLCLLILLAPTPLARFLAPISPSFFLRLPSLMEVLSQYLPMLLILNVVRSLLAGTCFYLAYQLVRETPSIHTPPAPTLLNLPISDIETSAHD
jgi:hypothetical protein